VAGCRGAGGRDDRLGGGDLAEGADPKPGVWTWGARLGFLKDTPDGTAFELNANVEAFVLPNLSVGPLLQLGFTGDSAQLALWIARWTLPVWLYVSVTGVVVYWMLYRL